MVGCTSCGMTTSTCRRCNEPTCADHMATYRDECLDCSLAYYESLEKVRLKAWFVVGALLPWALYASVYSNLPSWSARSGGFRAITTGVPALDVMIMFAVVSWFAGKAMIGLRKWFHHRSFVTRELARARLVRY